MTVRTTTPPVTPDDLKIAKNDPALSLVYKATNEADLIAMVDSMGIADPQHYSMMLGLLKLANISLRQLAGAD